MGLEKFHKSFLINGDHSFLDAFSQSHQILSFSRSMSTLILDPGLKFLMVKFNLNFALRVTVVSSNYYRTSLVYLVMMWMYLYTFNDITLDKNGFYHYPNANSDTLPMKLSFTQLLKGFMIAISSLRSL